ncbi:hypothetical protein JTB14_020113 [Gonioctena quinquepunctata]|nr:hypothetical protein JTB14_020113 [Gonioctena quinquepunctata]
MKLFILCCVLLILAHLERGECKRGGSRGGGRGKSSSGGSGWLWSSNKKPGSKKTVVTQTVPDRHPKPAPGQVAKPSAAHPEQAIFFIFYPNVDELF